MEFLEKLPNRPLEPEEIESINSDLPDGVNVKPYIIEAKSGTNCVPVMALYFPSGSVFLMGFKPSSQEWVEVDKWEAEEYDAANAETAAQDFLRNLNQETSTG